MSNLFNFPLERDDTVTCPHGIKCEYVYRTTVIEGETYVVGGDYWHDEDTRCTLSGSVKS